ncbi:MAG: Fe-S cluster protein [Deltaproteobacteria bacterium]|nr:MAG: Fe-S cluster protein [Deltaproteobacteria bacterium]
MLLKEYRKEIFRPECNPQFQSLHCIAHLNEDISEVLPYLNSVLGGHQYLKDPPALTLKVHGKLITLHPREIAVNALKDEIEADKILEWLRQEINSTWEKRDAIEPSFDTPAKPRIFDILKLLPKTNCGECGQPTCTVFASVVAQGAKGPEDCPPLDDKNKMKIQEYLRQFTFDS